MRHLKTKFSRKVSCWPTWPILSAIIVKTKRWPGGQIRNNWICIYIVYSTSSSIYSTQGPWILDGIHLSELRITVLYVLLRVFSKEWKGKIKTVIRFRSVANIPRLSSSFRHFYSTVYIPRFIFLALKATGKCISGWAAEITPLVRNIIFGSEFLRDVFKVKKFIYHVSNKIIVFVASRLLCTLLTRSTVPKLIWISPPHRIYYI